MTTSEATAWAAGFFDGEGSVGVYKTGKSWLTPCSVGNTDRASLEFLQERWGGTIYDNPVQKGCHLPCWKWVCTDTAFLRAIRPYLLIKGDQVDLYLEFRATVSTARLTPEVRARREEIVAELKELKHGVPEVTR